jgi:hypothetical protein
LYLGRTNALFKVLKELVVSRRQLEAVCHVTSSYLGSSF